MGIQGHRLFAGLALSACLALAGCGSEPLAINGLSGSGASVESKSTDTPGSAYPTTADASKATASSPFQPFTESISSSIGGREVIANPTLAEVMQTGKLPEMSFGRADAPVTIIKYASMTCPFCRKFHAEVFPQIKREYIDTGKVRFIIREFPIGRSSGNATIALRCAKPEKYLDLYGKLLAQQASWVSQEVRIDAIFAVAQQVGMKRAEFDACLKDQALIDGLQWVKDRGRTLGVIGTPNFFIQGKLVKRVLALNELREIIETSLKGANTAAVAN